MIGQDHLLERLNTNGPFIIIGPKGSGKTTLAKAIILRSICENHQGCEECKACRTFLNSNYPDFHMILGGKIEDIRELLGKISVKPYYEKHYVLLDDVDKMTIPAQNALLKTIEEPVSPTLFVLTGTTRNSILKTILSRCFKLSPQLLEPSIIFQELKKKYPEEREDFLQDISEYANGSLGYAIDMIERKDFYEMLNEDIQNIKKRNFFEMASRYAAKEYKEDILTVFSFFEKYLRDTMVRYVEENRDTTPVYEVIQSIEKYRTELNNNINPNMMYQNLILKMQQMA